MADRQKSKTKARPEPEGHSPRVNFRVPRGLFDRCAVLGATLEAAARRKLSPSDVHRALLEAGARAMELGKPPEQILVDTGLLMPSLGGDS